MTDNLTSREQWPPKGFEPYVPKSPFLLHNGTYYERIVPGDAETFAYQLTLKVEEQHLNTTNTLHGGMAAAMGDFMIGRMIWAFMPDKQFVTANLTTDFISSPKAGSTLIGTARFTRLGKTLAFAEARLESGGKLVASYRGIWKRVFDRKREEHSSNPLQPGS